ncbi:MAG: hypothetical protein WDZ91_04735 [Paenibacillaceae bacterium]
MTSMGNVGSNYGMSMGMGKGGVGGVQAGPNVSAANVGHMPSAYAPAYANPSYLANPAPIAPAYVAGVGAAPCWNMAGIVLVLYILLVIITRSVLI